MAAKAKDTNAYYLGIYRRSPEPIVEICASKIQGFSKFTEGTVADVINLTAPPAVKSCKPGQRMDIEQQSYCMHLYATQGSYPQAELVILLITDLEYNRMVAHSQLQGIIDEFSTNITQQQVLNAKSKLDITWLDKSQSKPRLDVLLTQARQPDKPDSISKIKQELDETKIVLHKTIEAVLERGEKIEDLVAKSTNLSFASKMFYTQAKKQNSCCILM